MLVSYSMSAFVYIGRIKVLNILVILQINLLIVYSIY